MAMSAVRNRIASFEAQTNATRINNPGPESPLRSLTPNRSRKSVGSLVASHSKRRGSFSKQQQILAETSMEPPGLSPSGGLMWNPKKQLSNKSTGTSSTPSILLPNITSTTMAASQNRKSRLRQSHHQLNNENLAAQQQQQATNLVEKRKLIKERRLMQKQRRAAVSSSCGGDQGEASLPSETLDYDNSASRTPSSSSPADFHHNSIHHRNNSADEVTHSPGRFAKIQRLTRRKGYENVVKLRGPKMNQSQQTQQHHSSRRNSSVASVTATTVTLGSSNATSLMKNTISSARNRGSPNPSPIFDENTLTDNHNPTSNRSSVPVGKPENHGPLSPEAHTDDEATLTSVRRIMNRSEDINGHNNHHLQGNRNTHGSYDSFNSSNGGDASTLWKQPASTQFNNHQSNGSTTLGVHNNRRDVNTSHWSEEEKSNNILGSNLGTTGPRVLRTASSSDYDTDGDVSKTSRQSMRRMLEGPTHSQATDNQDFFVNSKYSQPDNHRNKHQNNNTIQSFHSSTYNNTSNSVNSAGHRRLEDDERTFDYGDRDDDSIDSTSYAMRRRKEAERRARLGGNNNSDSGGTPSKPQDPKTSDHDIAEGLPTLLSKEDMEKYTKTMENPAMKLGVGVVGVATVGCIAFGPVGLLIGVAAVGLGFGVMQIPEEERNKIQAKAEKAIHNFQEKAIDASEKISSNCLNTYKDSGVADHLPHCLSGADGDEKDMESTRSEHLCNAGAAVDVTNIVKRTSKADNQAGSTGPQVEQPPTAQMKQHHSDRLRSKKVACLRNVRIMPVTQIHALEPSAQPRAWLDILASANTSNGQKNEAMEEILLLAKDKRRAKIFLDEGILDSLLWILSRYFEKLEVVGKPITWAFPDISPDEKVAANLAAQCCMNLGKSHCAAIHTEGDLQLMSMYERGTVPEERQVAQMLHEVPHHTRITKTKDPTVIEPSKEVFALRQLSLPQAEELAKSIKAVAESRL